MSHNAHPGDLQNALSAAFAEQSVFAELNVSVESLIARYPVLATSSEAILDLIYHEIVLREDRGEEVEFREYQSRFASLSQQLSDLFEVHAATGESSSLVLEDTVDSSDNRRMSGDSAELPRHVAGSDAGQTRYTDLRPHASGGVGVVSLAFDRELDRRVALKQIRGQLADRNHFRDRFLREAKITGRLEHPGVVPVYSLGSLPDGNPYYAMRFIGGRTLGAAIQQFHLGETSQGTNGASRRRSTSQFDSLEFRRLVQRFMQVCETVAYAHSRKVIHRDLKPANVMLGEFGETLVVDWGLAKLIEGPEAEAVNSLLFEEASEASNSSVNTSAGDLIGTPSYMSPEQVRRDPAAVTSVSDVYGLGAILYEMITGRPPFRPTNGNLAALLESIQAADFEPVEAAASSKVPKRLAAICRKAMATRPEDRYPTATALRDDLERWMADESVSVCKDTWTDVATRFVRRHRAATLTALTAFMLLSILAGIAAFVFDSQRRHSNLVATQKAQATSRSERLLSRSIQILASGYKDAGVKLQVFGGRSSVLWRDLYRNGVSEIRELLKESPENEELLFVQCTFLEEIGKSDTDLAAVESESIESLSIIEKLVSRNPSAKHRAKYAEVLNARSSLLSKTGRELEAVELSRLAIVQTDILRKEDDSPENRYRYAQMRLTFAASCAVAARAHRDRSQQLVAEAQTALKEARLVNAELVEKNQLFELSDYQLAEIDSTFGRLRLVQVDNLPENGNDDERRSLASEALKHLGEARSRLEAYYGRYPAARTAILDVFRIRRDMLRAVIVVNPTEVRNELRELVRDMSRAERSGMFPDHLTALLDELENRFIQFILSDLDWQVLAGNAVDLTLLMQAVQNNKDQFDRMYARFPYASKEEISLRSFIPATNMFWAAVLAGDADGADKHLTSLSESIKNGRQNEVDLAQSFAYADMMSSKIPGLPTDANDPRRVHWRKQAGVYLKAAHARIPLTLEKITSDQYLAAWSKTTEGIEFLDWLKLQPAAPGTGPVSTGQPPPNHSQK